MSAVATIASYIFLGLGSLTVMGVGHMLGQNDDVPFFHDWFEGAAAAIMLMFSFLCFLGWKLL